MKKFLFCHLSRSWAVGGCWLTDFRVQVLQISCPFLCGYKIVAPSPTLHPYSRQKKREGKINRLMLIQHQLTSFSSLAQSSYILLARIVSCGILSVREAGYCFLDENITVPQLTSQIDTLLQARQKGQEMSLSHESIISAISIILKSIHISVFSFVSYLTNEK